MRRLPASIADILDQVLSADIEELADKLEGPVETPPAAEDPDQAARRRLGANRPTAGGPARPPAIGR